MKLTEKVIITQRRVKIPNVEAEKISKINPPIIAQTMLCSGGREKAQMIKRTRTKLGTRFRTVRWGRKETCSIPATSKMMNPIRLRIIFIQELQRPFRYL